MKNLIELKFLETFGQSNKIIFFVNVSSTSNHVDLSLLETLPELSRRSGKKTVPATEHEKLFDALKQIIQTNPNLFYIDNQALKNVLAKLEKNEHISHEQLNAYQTVFNHESKEPPCLKPIPKFAKGVDGPVKTVFLNTREQTGEPLLKSSPNSAFAGPGLFKPPIIKAPVTKPVSRSLPIEASFFPEEEQTRVKKKPVKRKSLPATSRFEPTREGGESCIIM